MDFWEVTNDELYEVMQVEKNVRETMALYGKLPKLGQPSKPSKNPKPIQADSQRGQRFPVTTRTERPQP